MYGFKKVPFETLVGKTLTGAEKVLHEEGVGLTFTTNEGEEFMQAHEQDCCECVLLEDVCGDLEDLLGTPILLAEEVWSEDPQFSSREDENGACDNWTFYKISTLKGSVTLRWGSTSNGNYSVDADLFRRNTLH